MEPENRRSPFHQGARVAVETPNGAFTGTIHRIREYRKRTYLIVRREGSNQIYTVPARYCIYLSAQN